MHFLLVFFLSTAVLTQSRRQLDGPGALTARFETAQSTEKNGNLEEAVEQLKNAQDNQLLAQNKIQETLERIEEQIAKNVKIVLSNKKPNLVDVLSGVNIYELEEGTKPKNDGREVMNKFFENIELGRDRLLRIVKKIEECEMNAPLPDVKIKCEEPFIPVAGTCMFFETETKSTYYKAIKLCKSRGGQMAIFKTFLKFKETQDYIRYNIVQKNTPNLWIGGYRDFIDDVWKWIDGSEIFLSPKFWQIYEPNNERGREDKACMNRNAAFLMHDLHADTLCGVVCEKEGTPIDENESEEGEEVEDAEEESSIDISS